jgi:2-methylcitrate dehydratase
MNESLPYDDVLTNIGTYVADDRVDLAPAIETAHYCLLDSLACAFEALDYTACTKLLGPQAGSIDVPDGARVPGTPYRLDPATAAFNIGCLVRWLDFNDTWTAAQTCHPSDDVGPILALADSLSRRRAAEGQKPFTVGAVLEAMVKAHEIQGVLGMENALSDHGLDHVLFLKIGVTGTLAGMLGGSRVDIANAVSLAFFEPSLALHRYGSNTGPRKGWAAAEASAQSMRFAHMAVAGEPGYPQVLTHPKWGFNKVFFHGEAFRNTIPFNCCVMRDVLFKIQAPVVIHAQSAVEAAIRMHGELNGRFDDIARIELHSHSRTLAIIDKTGPLRNAADRDHCLQYAVAVALLQGRLSAADYEDDAAADPRIDRLRGLMQLAERESYTQAYRDPARKLNPNSIQVFFNDGSKTPLIEVMRPLGDPARRAEGMPLLIEKFKDSVGRRFAPKQAETILRLCLDHDRLLALPVPAFTDMLST